MGEHTSQPCMVKAEMEEGARRQGNNRPGGHGLTLFAASFPLIKDADPEVRDPFSNSPLIWSIC